MKKIIASIIVMFTIISLQAQENFKWDEVIEIKGTKDELFSKAKLVLAQIYNDSEHVSRNTDKDAGIILSKPKTIVYLSGGMSNIKYVFEYELTIMVKDGRYRILINSINNPFVYGPNGNSIPSRANVIVSTVYPYENAKNWYERKGLKPNKYFELLKPLRDKLQNIFNSIKEEMQKETIINDDW